MGIISQAVAQVQNLETRQLLSALFVSKDIVTDGQTFTGEHSVITSGHSFTQTIRIRNTDSVGWTGLKMVHVGGDSLGGTAESVAVPCTQPKGIAVISLPLKANKNLSQGAAQLGSWQLQDSRGNPITIQGLTYGLSKFNGKLEISITINPPPSSNTPNLANIAYQSGAYVNNNWGGQCTAFVSGRAREKGFSWTYSGGPGQAALDWATNNHKTVSLQIQATKGHPAIPAVPRANAIAVWTGHVAYVEAASGGNVTINEANVTSFSSYAGNNDPSGAWWGGGYDGNGPQTMTADHLATGRTGVGTFLGYIYL